MLAGMNSKECLKLARKFEDWGAAIRGALRPKSATSCDCAGNYYINIGLSKHQIARLKLASKVLLKPVARTSGAAAWWLLNIALANLEFMQMLLLKNNDESIRSNLKVLEFWWESKSRASLDQLN